MTLSSVPHVDSWQQIPRCLSCTTWKNTLKWIIWLINSQSSSDLNSQSIHKSNPSDPNLPSFRNKRRILVRIANKVSQVEDLSNCTLSQPNMRTNHQVLRDFSSFQIFSDLYNRNVRIEPMTPCSSVPSATTSSAANASSTPTSRSFIR